jgi:hypothetical protein
MAPDAGEHGAEVLRIGTRLLPSNELRTSTPATAAVAVLDRLLRPGSAPRS